MSADSATKRRVLDTTVRLMLDKGFNATSVDEICAEVGLTKGGFFHHFRSKEDLALTALKAFFDIRNRALDRSGVRQIEDPLKRMHAHLDLMCRAADKTSEPRSCLIGNFSQELWSTRPELRAACAEAFTRLIDDFETDLKEACTKYAAGKNIDTRGISTLFLSIYQGSFVVMKSTGDTAILKQNVEHFRNYLDSIFS